MIPPAILNAGSVIPKTLKTRLPVSANKDGTRKQVNAARRATWRRESWSPSAVIVRKATGKGSTRKKMEVNAISENLTTAAKVAPMVHPKVVPHYSPASLPEHGADARDPARTRTYQGSDQFRTDKPCDER